MAVKISNIANGAQREPPPDPGSNTGMTCRYKSAVHASLLAGAALTSGNAQTVPGDGGTWKFAPAPSGIHAEFNAEDPVALAAGAHIKTDCSINLALDGRTYCFTTRMSLDFFEQSPQNYLSAAQNFFDGAPTQPKQ
jgi:YHS domain-containing protein